ncbi:GNAT family N-acetyltransferase [bacterium]|nr:GNAT family N-acetyltransferase [bacterium]
MFKIQIINHQDLEQAKKLHELQMRSYQIEADLLNYPNLPPLLELVEDIVADQDQYLTAMCLQEICGFLAYKESSNVVEIDKVVVDPKYFRKGVASLLLENLIIKTGYAKDILVSTGTLNLPAIALYKKYDFQLVDQFVVGDSLEICSFKRSFKSS